MLKSEKKGLSAQPNKKKTVTISSDIDYLGVSAARGVGKPPLAPPLTPSQVILGSPVVNRRTLLNPSTDYDDQQ